MRERITVAFVVLALAVLVGAGTVRAFSLRDILREETAAHLQHEAELTTRLIAEHSEAELPVDEAYLQDLVSPHVRLEYTPPAGGTVVVEGSDFEASGEDDPLESTVTSDVGTVIITEKPGSFGNIVGRDPVVLLAVGLLIVALAGLVGYVAARTLSRPFRKLAEAAEALGRGRFDLDLPKTRIPEAQEIGKALNASAKQLESRLLRERQFAEQASHELRTPITALRLELEELTLRDDVPDDVKASAARSLHTVDEMSASAGKLVELARGSLVEGAQVSLQTLATQQAQRWADRLVDDRRKVSASAEGNLDLQFTPGPVEHVLDLVLDDVVRDGKAPVRLTFFAEQTYLRVTLPAGVIVGQSRVRGRRRATEKGVAQARVVAEAQGGRLSGDGVTEDLEILLPRR